MPAIQDPNLGLNYGYGLGEDGWNVGIDANFKKLGALLHLSVKTRTLSAPPGSPVAGDRYIVGASATGAWAGHEKAIAVYISASWEFFAPNVGWKTYVEDEALAYNYNGSAWVSSVGSQPYDLHATYNGRMDNGVTLMRVVLPRTTLFPAGLTGSYAKSEVAAALSSVCTITKNGTAIATITWAPGATSGTFTMATDQTFSAGDMLELTAPPASDTTLADISITLVGQR